VNDTGQTWRVIYRTDADAVLVLALYSKKTSKTPKHVIDRAKNLIREYDAD
jgi:phage-related protein